MKHQEGNPHTLPLCSSYLLADAERSGIERDSRWFENPRRAFILVCRLLSDAVEQQISGDIF